MQGAARPFGMPDCDAHGRPLGGEAPHEPPAEESRAAEHADRGHGIPSGMDKIERSCSHRPKFESLPASDKPMVIELARQP